MEPQEILNIFERLSHQQQWSNRETICGSGGKYEVDQLALMQAKIDALQSQMDKQKASSKMVQVQACALCGDETHAYKRCPLAQPDGDMGASQFSQFRAIILPKATIISLLLE